MLRRPLSISSNYPMAVNSGPAERDGSWRQSGGNMKLKTSGMGLIALGILLLGAQLVLYLGFKNIYPPPGSGETHIEPPPQVRLTPLPGVFGALSLIAGIALVAK